MAATAGRLEIPYFTDPPELGGILPQLPTRGTNPWVDGISYGAKLINPGTNIYSSINHSPYKTLLLNAGLDIGTGGVGDEEPVEVRFSFNEDASTDKWTDNLKEAYRSAFQAWSKVANIRFTEVSQDSNSSDITYYRKYEKSTTLGAHQGLLDQKDPAKPYTSWINSMYYGENTPTQKGSGFLETAIHEIGHGIGQSHPHDGGLSPFNMSPVFPGLSPIGEKGDGDNFAQFGHGLFALNQTPNTVMSYNRGLYEGVFGESLPPGEGADIESDTLGHVATPMALDVMESQIKYGYNTGTALLDNIYSLAAPSTGGRSFWECIWDSGGIDTVSAGNATGNTVLDLRPARMNAYRPQSGEMSENYNWRALGVTSDADATALQSVIDFTIVPGSLLGTGAKFALSAPTLIGDFYFGLYPELRNQSFNNGAWKAGQSFSDYLENMISEKGIAVGIITTVSQLRIWDQSLYFADAGYAQFKREIERDQNILLLESSQHVGGYFSMQYGVQGGFTIAAGVEIEKAIGGMFNDSINGNYLNNSLQGGKGSDYIQGFQGDDEIRGGAGGDIIDGGVGSDLLYGGTGANTFANNADGDVDQIYILSEYHYVNEPGSPFDNSQNADIISSLGVEDRITILGATTDELSIRQLNDGLGIFASGSLEAIVTDSNWTAAALGNNVFGDASRFW